jgi:type II secretory ATPase GspE/PulE/Tfp pilus assembly ATPase PilB-like protein
VKREGDAHLPLRFRTDGRLHELRRIPIGLLEALIGYLKQSAGMEVSERRLPQDGRIPSRMLVVNTNFGSRALRLSSERRS